MGRCGVCEWREVGVCGVWRSGGVVGWWRCPRGWGERHAVPDDSSIGGGWVNARERGMVEGGGWEVGSECGSVESEMAAG